MFLFVLSAVRCTIMILKIYLLLIWKRSNKKYRYNTGFSQVN